MPAVPNPQTHSSSVTRTPAEEQRRVTTLRYLERRLELLEKHMVAVAELGIEADLRDLVRTLHGELAAVRPSNLQADEGELPSLERVRRRFALTDFEDDVLLLALAPYVDGRFGDYIAALKRNVGRTVPDVGLALALFSESFGARIEERTRFGAAGALIRNNLITLDQRLARDGNLLDVGLRLPARMQGLLLEASQTDPLLEGFSRLHWPSTPMSQVVLQQAKLDEVFGLVGRYEEWQARRLAWGYEKVGESGAGMMLLFSGTPGTGKTLLAYAVARHLGRPLLLVDAYQLHAQRELEAHLDAIMREARLQRAVLFFDDCESLFGSRLGGNRELPTLLKTLDTYDGLSILATNLATLLDPALDRRVTLQIDFEVPPPRLRERIWRLHIPPEAPLADDVDVPFLAEKYEFAGGYIRNCVVVALNSALARAGDGEVAITMADFDAAARTQVRHRLKQLAIFGGTHLTLDDLVLPADIKDRLHAIVAAVRNRRVIFEEWGFGEKLTTGKGLCILFRGDSGTGKTLAAEILGNELAMPLYRVRIPSIVSKYVGETEKNLEKCFREAALAGALLLFDEADSIFSKRVEVGSSNDRYSNMEVNLLLQEVERFEGVVILTTNLDAGIDDAFERRLNFKIDFPFPETTARARIWRQLIPSKAPLGENVNFDYLGDDFELSGGCIKNAVLRAAYNAAELRIPITMELLERSAEQEYREIGKLVPIRRNPWD